MLKWTFQQNIRLSQSHISEDSADTLAGWRMVIYRWRNYTEKVCNVFHSHSVAAFAIRQSVGNSDWSPVCECLMMLVRSLEVRSVLCPVLNWWRGGLHHLECSLDGNCIWEECQVGGWVCNNVDYKVVYEFNFIIIIIEWLTFNLSSVALWYFCCTVDNICCFWREFNSCTRRRG